MAQEKKKTGCLGIIVIGFFVLIVISLVSSLITDDYSSPKNDPPPPFVRKSPRPDMDSVTTQVVEAVPEPTQEGSELSYSQVLENPVLRPDAVRLLEPKRVPVILNGEEVGEQIIPVNGKLQILEASESGILSLGFHSTNFKASYEETDFIDRALARSDAIEQAKLEAKAKAKAEAEKAEAEMKAAALAKQRFKEQFSGWNGSHRGVVKSVKRLMNDPDSFKHVETRYWYYEKTGGGRIRMTFRGKNAFGGTGATIYLYNASFEEIDHVDASKPFEYILKRPFVVLDDSFYFGAHGEIESGGGYMELYRDDRKGLKDRHEIGTFFSNLGNDGKSYDEVKIVWNPDPGTTGTFNLFVANGGGKNLAPDWNERNWELKQSEGLQAQVADLELRTSH